MKRHLPYPTGEGSTEAEMAGSAAFVRSQAAHTDVLSSRWERAGIKLADSRVVQRALDSKHEWIRTVAIVPVVAFAAAVALKEGEFEA